MSLNIDDDNGTEIVDMTLCFDVICIFNPQAQHEIHLTIMKEHVKANRSIVPDEMCLYYASNTCTTVCSSVYNGFSRSDRR